MLRRLLSITVLPISNKGKEGRRFLPLGLEGLKTSPVERGVRVIVIVKSLWNSEIRKSHTQIFQLSHLISPTDQTGTQR
jgi:hypothetical protein